MSGFWYWLDTLAHKLHLPGFLLGPICDQYDLSLGITREELKRKALVLTPGFAVTSSSSALVGPTLASRTFLSAGCLLLPAVSAVH